MRVELDTTIASKGELEGLRDMLDTILDKFDDLELDEEDESEETDEELDEELDEEIVVKPVPKVSEIRITHKEPTSEDDDNDVI